MNTGAADAGLAAAVVGIALPFGLPFALAFIMFYLGLTLKVAHFRGVLARPRALAVGFAGQLVLVPLAAFAVARGSGLEPALAIGLMVLGACPGGVSSGLLTHLARGDVALSIALTAVTSVVAMASMPLVLDASLRLYGERALAVELPLAASVVRIFVLTTLPVLAGMALAAGRPRFVARVEPAAGRAATALFVLIVLATFWSQRDVLFEQLPRVGPACALLNALILAASWWASRLAGVSRADAVAIATECGLQNAALGIYVTVELLRAPALAVPSVVYALLMNVGAIAFVALMRRTRVAPPLGAAANG